MHLPLLPSLPPLPETARSTPPLPESAQREDKEDDDFYDDLLPLNDE